MNEIRKKSFNPGYVENELSKVDKALTERTVIYVIGGAVMAHRGLKFGTKDVDVVLENRNSGKRVVDALKNCGYGQLLSADLTKEYINLSAEVLENIDGFRWDIFVKVVARKLFLSDGMKSRSEAMFKGRFLTALNLSNEDIFLLKGMTSREGDVDDMFQLVRTGIDYDKVYSECLSQSEKTGKIWESALYDQCVDLEKKYGIALPFMKKFRKIAEEKILQLLLKELLEDGPKSEAGLCKMGAGLEEADIKAGLAILERRRKIVRSPDGTISLIK